MKLQFIRNKKNEILAVQIMEKNFYNYKIKEIMDLIRDYGVVICKQSNLTIEDYYHWQLRLGYHQPSNMWCEHKKYPIFYRVTNKKIDKDNTGLFGDGALDWHTDQLFIPESEELLSLFGVTIPEGAITQFANSIPYFKRTSSEVQKRWKNLKIIITNNIQKTYEKKGAPHYKLPPNQQKDFDKRRASRDIRKSLNFPKQFSHLYEKSRFTKEGFRRLIPIHPLGAKGIYFPHFSISSITDDRGVRIPDDKQLYIKIKSEYIDSGEYIYSHYWQKGDIVLSDQLITLHRKNDLFANSSVQVKPIFRELFRTSCWYKTDYRITFQKSL